MDSYQQQFVDWMKTDQVGCGFAKSFAKREDVAGLQGVTVVGNSLGDQEIIPLNLLLAAACSKSQGVYVIFPDIESTDEVIGLIRGLCGTRVWECIDLTSDISPPNDALVIGLRWHLPDGKHMNYVLGFANLPDMPQTRRSPHTTLVLRTGPPGRAPGVAFAHNVFSKKDERGLERVKIPVHLADMPDLLPTEESIATLWRQTMKLKRTQLEKDPMAGAARAKVTFCLPSFARRALADLIDEQISIG
jgi:hypothetical protein